MTHYHQRLGVILNNVNPYFAHYSYPLKYPLDKDTLFVKSPELFKLLDLSEFVKANQEKIKMDAAPFKPKEKLTKPPISSKKPREEKSLPSTTSLAEASSATIAATGGAGTDESYHDDATEDICDFFSFLKTKIKPAPTSNPKISSSSRKDATSVVLASLKKTEEFLSTLQLHPRVEAWQESIDKGLDYYGFKDSDSMHYLSYDEMAIRHKLPKDLPFRP